jgi:CHAD domain-containing protein
VPQSPADHIEVEWQYSVRDPAAVADWLEVARVPGYTVRPLKDRRFKDTYFDTADWRLNRGGYTCRVRRLDESAELTLKTMAAAEAGLRSRREMNESLTDPQLRPEAAPGECGAAVRLMAGRRHLETLFTLDQHRRTYALADDEGDLGEIAVDETAVERTDVSFRRVEIEVDAEVLARTERFRALLVEIGRLEPASTSKFEAAMAAVGLRAAPPERTLGDTAISATMTAGETAFAVMRKHFGVFLANEPGTRLGEDIEALHDMRVAARRLRAAMQAFRANLPERAQGFRDELGYIGRALGEVRDLDVFLENLEAWEREDPEHAEALVAVGAVLRDRRTAARGRMLAVLDRRRYDLFIERFAAFLRRGSPPSPEAGRLPILEVAPALLRRRYRSLSKLGNAITAKSPPDDYHALRIEGKKLRYALEFVSPVYGAPAIDFARRLTALQDVLGLHQDAYVAIDLLNDLASSSGRRLGPETLLAMGATQERYRVHAAEHRTHFPAVYRPLAGQWRTLEKALSDPARKPKA